MSQESVPLQPISAVQLVALEPPTLAERGKRAMFLAAQLSRHGIELIRDFLHRCDAIDFSKVTALEERPELHEDDHYQAVKELTVLSIWLTLAEQLHGGMPDWLKEFFAESWDCTDIIFDFPTSKEILSWYPATGDLDQTFDTAAMRLCYGLQAGQSMKAAPLVLAELIRNAAQVRALILSDALRQPLDQLDAKVESQLPK